MSDEDEAYSLPWMKRWRKDAFKKMQSLVVVEKESPALKAKRTKLKNLQEQVSKLHSEISKSCPHVLENQRYEECGRQNDLGSWASGMDYLIRCTGCGKYLADWSSEDE